MTKRRFKYKLKKTVKQKCCDCFFVAVLYNRYVINTKNPDLTI